MEDNNENAAPEKEESLQEMGYTEQVWQWYSTVINKWVDVTFEEWDHMKSKGKNPKHLRTIFKPITPQKSESPEIDKEEELWKLSRERMPEFDGMYYVYGFMHHPCGNVTPFHKIVECKNNQWVKSDEGEQMTCWRNLLEPPVNILNK